MRKELIVGLSLAVATLLIVVIGEWLELELTSTVLLGVTAGAVVGLVPDRSVAARVGGFAAGFVISWIGYFIRAALMPDTETGRAIAFALVVLVALGVTLVSVGRLPFWSVLLGVSTFAGAFEALYTVAPPQVLDNSIATASTLLLTVAVGFLAVSWFGPEQRPHGHHDDRAEHDERVASETPRNAESPRTRKDDTVAFDSMMGNNR